MNRFCSTSQEMWIMCIKNSMRYKRASRKLSEHILERLDQICFVLTVNTFSRRFLEITPIKFV